MKKQWKVLLRAMTFCGAALCCLLLVSGQGYAATAPGPDGFGYTTASTTYDWVDISGSGTSVTLTDDDRDGPFNTGFTFSFYGVDYTQFYIQSNGMINFADEYISYSNSCPLPDDGEAENMIALQWDDLDPSSGGNIYYQAYAAGSCPYDSYSGACLVVQFQDIPPCCGSTSPASTFQGILFDNDSVVIQFNNSELGADWGEDSTIGIQGNSFAHDRGLSYACNTASSLTPGLAVSFRQTATGVSLSPVATNVSACSGKINTLDYEQGFYDNNGGNATFNLNYNVTSNNGTLTGPATVTVVANSTEPFQVNLAGTGQVGDVVTATVTTVGAGQTRVSDITMSITSETFEPIAEEPDNGRDTPVVAAYDKKIWSIAGQGGSGPVLPVRTYTPETDTWATVSSSEAPFGQPSIRAYCQVVETVYIFNGDTGLYSYNMSTNTWSDLSALPGQPIPDGLNYGAMVYDEQAGHCYLTGGSSKGSKNTVYVFSPAAQQWLSALPSFEHGRYSHAAWMVGTGTDKKLCIAGGDVDLNGTTSEAEEIVRLKTTQCYSFAKAAWNPEDADLGALPEPLAGMGFAKKKNCSSSEELWLVGGVDAIDWNDLTAKSWYYDLQTSSWRTGPLLSQASGACGAVNFENELFKISGYDSNWNTSGVSERLKMCKGCFSWPMFMPATTGIGR